jgi:hypothetical protein
MRSPCGVPITETVWKSVPVAEVVFALVFALIRWRNTPAVSSIMYNCPFDMMAKVDVVGVTLQSLYFSRTEVQSPLLAVAAAPPARFRSPVPL